MRIFTNEVATVNALERADNRVEAVAWEDPLAFGRLVSGNDLDAFATARSFAYAAANWDEDNVIEADLKLRNEELKEAFGSGGEVCLLFGGSLVDQLRLAQILSWLSERSEDERAQARLMLVDGSLSVFEGGALLEIARVAEPLSAGMLGLYSRAWDAVSGTNPLAVEAVLERAAAEGFSSLATGLSRWLQELPSVENGLSITQMQILDAVRLGVSSPQALFEAVQATEAPRFRINWEFWQLLDGLCASEQPLLEVAGGGDFLCPPAELAFEAFHAQSFKLTERGAAILEGRGNCLNGPFPERWLGGAKIDAESPFFWDYANRRVVGLASKQA
ncbi:hypothetical protein VDG1235_2520 [Verrucomicrobiia bacterium DG1235]|nr:hypothetical protein VDG1235_2520 [Verrucomicrobiae bacterium DG1235]